MSNRKASFELYIAIDAFDDGEWYEATCTVTYPACASQPAMTQEYKGEREWDVISKATKDIQKFLEEPDEWVRTYVEQSNHVGRKLAYAREQLTAHQERAASYRRQAETDEKHVELLRQEIAQLEGVKE